MRFLPSDGAVMRCVWVVTPFRGADAGEDSAVDIECGGGEPEATAAPPRAAVGARSVLLAGSAVPPGLTVELVPYQSLTESHAGRRSAVTPKLLHAYHADSRSAATRGCARKS